MTKPTTPLLDALRAAREDLQYVSKYVHDYCVIIHPKGSKEEREPEMVICEKLNAVVVRLNAHIAWRESGECVEAAAKSIYAAAEKEEPEQMECFPYAGADGGKTILDGAYSLGCFAKAAIKAMEGGE